MSVLELVLIARQRACLFLRSFIRVEISCIKTSYKYSYLLFLFFSSPLFLAYFCGTKPKMGDSTTVALHTRTLRFWRQGVLFQATPSLL